MRFSTTKESPQHKKTNHTARTAQRKRERTLPLRFICLDGEGVTDEAGTHRYVLLGVGDKQISNPDGLSWQECFRFLYDNFVSGGTAFCGFFLGYDFTQWLRGLPEYQCWRLLSV